MPPDIHTTATALSALIRYGAVDPNDCAAIVKKIVENLDEDGLLKFYFAPSSLPSHLDHVAMCQSICFISDFYQLRPPCSVHEKLNETVRAINARIKDEAEDQRYRSMYFFYAAWQLANRWGGELGHIFTDMMIRSWALNINSSPISLAMRIMVNQEFGGRWQADKQQLLDLQQPDGGWPFDSLFRLDNAEEVYFGSRIIATSFALKALETLALQV
ncbi:MAG TPA: hypothetical protein PKI61_00855 [bacterium]|nr:hypothetical protein [bacterium]HPT29431.1 hypothetical protein [bacterium]